MPSQQYHLDLNKKFKKSIADLKNVSTIKGRLDLLRQYIKFEFGEVTNEFDGIGTLRYFLNDDFLFTYYWLGNNDAQCLEVMFDHMEKSLVLLERRLKKYLVRIPIIINYLRTNTEIPNVEVSLYKGYKMKSLIDKLNYDYGAKQLTCISKINSQIPPKHYVDFVRSLGINTHSGTVAENFEAIKVFVEENYT